MSKCPHCDQDLAPVLKLRPEIGLVGCNNCLNALSIETGNGGPTAVALNDIQTVSEMAPDGSVMAGVFAMMGEVIADLPVLPEVPQRILSMIHDPITSIGELADIIHEDAAISLKVTRMSNSALYASPHEITDLKTACSRLGMKTIAHIMHAVSNGNLYRATSRSARDIMEQLWRHAVASAHCADEISQFVPGIDANTPFVAGLVHDVGKLVLLDTLTTRYRGNIGRLKDSPDLLLRVLNHFHPIVGLHVVQYWKMQKEYAFTTFYNHRPEAVDDKRIATLTHVTALASSMAEACGYVVGKMEPPDLTGHVSAKALGISDKNLSGLRLNLPDGLESLMNVLGAP